DGIRDGHVTGVQTCALPICCGLVEFDRTPEITPALRLDPLGSQLLEARRGEINLGRCLAFLLEPRLFQDVDEGRELHPIDPGKRSEEHTLNSSHVAISYAVF